LARIARFYAANRLPAFLLTPEADIQGFLCFAMAKREEQPQAGSGCLAGALIEDSS
jgi:hypothetical protein